MSNTFSCQACGKQYKWRAELAGKKVRCKCGEVMRIAERPPEPEPVVEETYDLNVDSSGQPIDIAQTSAFPAGPCPGCGKKLTAGTVVCIECGHNRKTGKQIDVQTGRAVKSAGERHRMYAGSVDGFFGRLRRSWEFAKISYGVLWDFKQLVVFPILSGIATLLVLASFILPLWGMGTLDQWAAFLDEEVAVQNVDPLVWVTTFAFYFCCYFVITYFNTALAACAMKVCAGEAPTLGYGLSVATRRLPQLAGWALVAATVGMILKMIENANERVGRIIAAVMGAGWTILTYFVVPVFAVEGVGPVKALKRSVKILFGTWGEAVLGNFSMGILAFLVAFPVYVLLGLLLFFGISQQSTMIILLALALLVLFALLSAVVNSAADVVFKSMLYNYATGRTLPDEVDEEHFAAAFAGKG